MKTKLRVGIIINGTAERNKLNDLFRISKLSTDYEIILICIDHEAYQKNEIIKKIKSYGVYNFILSLLFKLIISFEKFLLIKLKKIFKQSTTLEQINIKLNDYDDNKLSKIKSLNLDLLLKNNFSTLEKEISSYIKLGILSIKFENQDISVLEQINFNNVLNKKKTTEFNINYLKNNSSEELCLIRGNIQNVPIFSLNLNKLLNKSYAFLDLAIKKISINNFDLINNEYLSSKKENKLNLFPSFLEQVNYLFSILNYIKNKFISKKPKWNIAYKFSENWKDFNLSNLIKIPNPDNRYFADPFIWKEGQVYYCFVEDFNINLNRACISVFEISSEGYKFIGEVLKENFHLSYPFIFKSDGQLYMCPETHEINEIRIYKCKNFPLEWELEKTLMKNISAVDTSIFFRENQWWLLTNMCSAKINDFTNELHIYSSDHFLKNNWIPHENNPVIIDTLKGRNGGLIIDDLDIYRVFQRQGFNIYGEAIGLAKILKLNKTYYKEDDKFKIEPNFFSNIHGTHTFNYHKGLLVIDYLKIDK
jgi:hypothetical protein